MMVSPKCFANEATPAEVQSFLQAALAAAPDETYDFKLHEDFMQHLAIMSPVATTLFYEQLSTAIFTHLIGLASTAQRKSSTNRAEEEEIRGIFGQPFGWSCVHEKMVASVYIFMLPSTRELLQHYSHMSSAILIWSKQCSAR